jgi:isochorismate pyruvate lyase
MHSREILSCESLEEVRSQIDRIDRQIVACIAERGAYVKQAPPIQEIRE